ncbi:hypothetical protein [Namhaeicola litoreus]|uniref:Uncharacterized protein n=1 Tax=Namhaeicola litoreus TaxID=1052145 RepID=A0ABW3Y416_9FLAO
MVKLQSVIFAFLFLMQSFQIHISDLLHLNDLIEHYSYHSDEFGDDLFSFIEKHYGTLTQNHLDDDPLDQQKHQNLPFHHISLQLDFQFLLNPVTWFIEDQENNSLQKQSYFYRFGEGVRLYSKVFQPPRN